MDKVKIRQIVAAFVLLAFFLSLGYIFKVAVGDNSFDPKDILMMMLGALVSKFSTVIDWFFGTSESSEYKTQIMSEMYYSKRINDDEPSN